MVVIRNDELYKQFHSGQTVRLGFRFLGMH